MHTMVFPGYDYELHNDRNEMTDFMHSVLLHFESIQPTLNTNESRQIGRI